MEWRSDNGVLGRAGAERSRTRFVTAPILLLLGFSFLVRTADSSSDVRLDQTIVLERLKREILRAELPSPPVELQVAVAQTPVPSTAVEASTGILREFRETVRKGDTFGGILKGVGIDSAEITRWSAAASEHAGLAKLVPGNSFTFLMPSGTSQLAGLQYELSLDSALVMREEGDSITARVERQPRMIRVLATGGEIRSSLYTTAAEAGVPETVISQIADVFGWDIDFDTDIRPGDTFRLAYEELRTANGKRLGGRLLAAELNIGGKVWEAFHFEANGGDENFYSSDGRAYGRSFLRFPVEFTRITSQFSTSRFHPILRTRRPHYGVDFAAPMGTPVRAISAGTIVHSGSFGGHGRYVKIDHGGGIESSYSHLRSINRSLEKGSRVGMGETIGTVGASGLATGAHLHFALWKNGDYVNPMNAKLPNRPALRGRHRSLFLAACDELRTQLAEIQIAPKPMVTVLTAQPVTGG